MVGRDVNLHIHHLPDFVFFDNNAIGIPAARGLVLARADPPRVPTDATFASVHQPLMLLMLIISSKRLIFVLSVLAKNNETLC